MGELGKNQVTEEEYVTHEFDPFDDTTITESRNISTFSAADVADYSFTFQRIQSGGEEIFDRPRLKLFSVTKKNTLSHSDALDAWGVLTINEIIFSANQENISCIVQDSATPEIIEHSAELDWYQSAWTGMLLFDSEDDIKKIAGAESLELRVKTNAGYVDLDDIEEHRFQLTAKLFYNQVYDKDAFADDLEEAKSAADAFKEAKSNSDNGGCFVATAVYGGEEHYNLIVLRSFRDNFLSKYVLGKKFISFYYKRGPILAGLIGPSNFLRALFKPFVDFGAFLVKALKIG